MSEVETVGIQRAAVIERMSTDLDFFAQVCLPEVYRYSFPPVHKAVWQMLIAASEKDEGTDNLALGIPRGFAKTILLKLFAVRSILFTQRQFIVVICNTAPLAENFIADVLDILASENIRRLFGDFRLSREKDTLSLQKFYFRGRDIVLMGAGAGTSVRGLNIKFVRPDILICDDMQSREEAESPTDSVRSLTWFLGTLLKFVSPHTCLNIFVGNMYPTDGSILKKLKHNPQWISFITGAILEDGESIWPELKPIKKLLAELESDTSMGHPEIFYAEVMNDEEAGSRSGVDISKIVGLNLDELPPFYEAGCIIIDPSMGKKKSDDIVIGALLIFEGLPVWRELVVGKFNPSKTIQEAIKLALKYRLKAILVESVAYQASLAFWFNHFIEQLGISGMQALEIYPRGSKNARIISALKDLQAGKIRVVSEYRALVVNQITQFNPAKPNNRDDILDVVAYTLPAMSEYLHAMNCDLFIESEESGASFSDDLVISF